MVGVHVRGAETVSKSGGQRGRGERFVVNIEEGRGRPRGAWSGCGFFCGGKEGARVAIPGEDTFTVRRRARDRPGTYMPPDWTRYDAAKRHRQLGRNFTWALCTPPRPVLYVNSLRSQGIFG